MGIEELKVIMNALSGMGAEAKEAFIWYLVLAKALPEVIHGFVFLVGIGVLFYIGLKIIKAVVLCDTAAMALENIKDVAGFDCWSTPKDIADEVIKFIKEHKGK